MKKVVMNQNSVSGKESSERKAISLFIINLKEELMLYKRLHEVSASTYVWHIPYFLYAANSSDLLPSAHEYLRNVGITDCDLYEAFTLTNATNHNESLLEEGHVVIALVTKAESSIHFSTDKYQWVPVNKILNDTDQHYATYSDSFKGTLESVILYVKNIIRHKSLAAIIQPPTHNKTT